MIPLLAVLSIAFQTGSLNLRNRSISTGHDSLEYFSILAFIIYFISATAKRIAPLCLKLKADGRFHTNIQA
jgi:NADH:ubiquinone oxidoreductase subunit H